MKKLTLLLVVYFMLFMSVSVKANETYNDIDMEKYDLLLNYASFGNIWYDELCAPRPRLYEIPRDLDELYKFWINTTNQKMNIDKKFKYDSLFSSAKSKDISATFDYFKITIDDGRINLLKDTSFCIRLKNLDELTTAMFKREKISDKISNNNYIIMSYTSFIDIWSSIIFNKPDQFKGDETLKMSYKYFNVDNNIEYYNHIIQIDVYNAKKFTLFTETLGFDVKAYMTHSPIFKRWQELDQQAYEFFSKRVGN